MRDEDVALDRGAFEKPSIRRTKQSIFRGRPQIAAARSKAFYDVWTDVLVCQEKKGKWLHAAILSSQPRQRSHPHQAGAVWRGTE